MPTRRKDTPRARMSKTAAPPRPSASVKSEAASLGDILEPVERDMDRVTDRLLECLQHPIARMVVYLITAGGKRLRPALVLLTGRAGNDAQAQKGLVDLAVAVELVHTATLIHDDIIDRSAMRRAQPTFHSRFGTERAVLMGDYLYASAFSLLAGLRDSYVTTYMADMCQQMSRGEFHEVECRYNLELTEEEYLEIVRDKTASLLAASCHLGAYLAGAKQATIERVTQFGWDLGMAFQIADDCLDLAGDERMVGKTLRSDLDKGSLSLPLIYLAGSLQRRQREKLFAPVKKGDMDQRFLTRIAHTARESGSVAQALRRAQRFATGATEGIALGNGIPLASAYHALANYAVNRVL